MPAQAPRRARRCAAALTLLTVGALAALLPVTAAARTPARALPPQGVFEGCDSSALPVECAQRLQQIAAAGFQLVVVPLSAYGPALTSYAHALAVNHLQAIWQLSDPGWWGADGGAWNMLTQGVYGSYAAACGCTTNDQLLAFVAQTLAASGVTHGWYVAADSQVTGEPPGRVPALLAAIGAPSAKLTALAPGTHTVMSTWGETDFTQFDEALGSAELTAQEAYPVAISWGECSADAQAAGVTAAARYPSAAAMLAMRNAALALRSEPDPVVRLRRDRRLACG